MPFVGAVADAEPSPDSGLRVPEVDVPALVPIGCGPDRVRVLVGILQQGTHSRSPHAPPRPGDRAIRLCERCSGRIVMGRSWVKYMSRDNVVISMDGHTEAFLDLKPWMPGRTHAAF